MRNISLISLLFVGGCVQPYTGPAVLPAGTPALLSQNDTAGIEEQDRVNRFRRLAYLQGTAPPEIDQIILPPGSVDIMSGEVPVVRVVFPEKAFFAFNDDTPLPASKPILDIIAENMKHDVPDAALTVLGHTDAIGTDAYNIDLSRRRAENVMRALVARGINPDQLSEVAIGKRQPIAPNTTDEGRALNRRVEFLISPTLSANLKAIEQRQIPARFFAVTAGLAPAATVYKLRPPPESTQPASPDSVVLAPLGAVPLQPVVPETVTPASIAPRPSPAPITPAPFSPAPPKAAPQFDIVPPSPLELRQPNSPAITY